MDWQSELLHEVKGGLFSSLTREVDVLHFLTVLSDGEPPTETEARYLDKVNRFLSVPVAGNIAWRKAVEKIKGNADLYGMALGYLNAGLVQAGLPEVADLESAKTPIGQLISIIKNREPHFELAAISHCPRCDFTFGVPRNGIESNS